MNDQQMQLLFDLLKELREGQKEDGEKLAKHSVYLENLDTDVRSLKNTVSKNTEDVAIHIKRTDLLEKLHLDNQEKIKNTEQRLDTLEEPKKSLNWFKSHLSTVVAIVTAILSIWAIIESIQGKK